MRSTAINPIWKILIEDLQGSFKIRRIKKAWQQALFNSSYLSQIPRSKLRGYLTLAAFAKCRRKAIPALGSLLARITENFTEEDKACNIWLIAGR